MGYLFADVVSTSLTIVIAVIVAAVLRRLLSHTPGWPRAVIVSIAALIAIAEISVPLGESTGLFQEGEFSAAHVGSWIVLLALAGCAILVAGMIVLVGLEILVPTGSIPGPFDVVSRTIYATQRWLRYLRLSWIALTSGLWRAARRGPSDPQFADAIVRMLNRSGATFVKVGQVLSTRTEMLPPELVHALSRLQADAAPIPYEAVRDVLVAEWGPERLATLSSLSQTPLAAASLAQVHSAELADGTEVVVKVRRPGIDVQVRTDCDILVRFATAAERRWQWARDTGLVQLAGGLARSLEEELDYRKEADNMRAIAESSRVANDIRIPAVCRDLSGERVLVMTRVRGAKLVSAAQTLGEEQRIALSRSLVSWTLESILVHGLFHADLHPGNVMLTDDGTVGVLDFGAIGVIGAEDRQLLATLLLSLVNGADVAAASTLTLLCRVSEQTDHVALQRELGRLAALHLGSGQPRADLFDDIMRFLQEYSVEIPGDIAGAMRTLVALWATLDVLRPGLGYGEILREALPGLMRRIAAPERVAARLAAETIAATAVLRRLPARVDRVSEALAEGRLTVRSRVVGDARDRAWITRIVDDVLSGLFAATFIIIAAVIFAMYGEELLAEGLTLPLVIAVVAGISGLVLALRLLMRVFRVRGGRTAHRGVGAD